MRICAQGSSQIFIVTPKRKQTPKRLRRLNLGFPDRSTLKSTKESVIFFLSGAVSTCSFPGGLWVCRSCDELNQLILAVMGYRGVELHCDVTVGCRWLWKKWYEMGYRSLVRWSSSFIQVGYTGGLSVLSILGRHLRKVYAFRMPNCSHLYATSRCMLEKKWIIQLWKVKKKFMNHR